MSESSFFTLKPKRSETHIIPDENEDISWRDIKPDKNYATIRKLFYQDQKKRKYSEFLEQKKNENQMQQGFKKAPGQITPQRKKFKHNNDSYQEDKNLLSTTTNSAKNEVIRPKNQEYEQLIQEIKLKQPVSSNKQQEEESKEDSKLQKEKNDKVALLFMHEVNQTLDRESLNMFKEALRKLKKESIQIDLFASDILAAFFKSSLGVALSDENDLHKLKKEIIELENYQKLKHLASEVTIYINRKQRDRFNHIIKSFTEKYELLYPQTQKGAQTRSQHNSQMSHLTPNKHSASQQKNSQSTTTVKPVQEQKKEVIIEEKEEDEDIIKCCICFEHNNLQISKCKHVACLECWTQWLDKYLECPTCRGRLRKHQIFPMNQEDKKLIKESKRCSQSQNTKEVSNSQQRKHK